MNTHNVLYNAEQINDKVLDCSKWINGLLVKDPDIVICPILQSSFYFTTHLFPLLFTQPLVDFCGVSFYAADGTEDGLYMYKGPDIDMYNNKTVIVLDVICNTGTTMDYVSRFIKQMGAKKVYTASLLFRQFSVHKPTWKGFTISDEAVYGYGIDKRFKYRTLPYIAYE